MWDLDHKESWALKNWCFWIVLEKTLESPLDSKEIKTVNCKGNQSWLFLGRTDAEAVAPIIWPPDVKNWLIRKDLDAGKDWRQEKGTTGGEMVGWHHWLNGHEFEQAPGDGEGQGSLAYCSPWSRKESDMTKLLNNNRHWEQCCEPSKQRLYPQGMWWERQSRDKQICRYIDHLMTYYKRNKDALGKNNRDLGVSFKQLCQGKCKHLGKDLKNA